MILILKKKGYKCGTAADPSSCTRSLTFILHLILVPVEDGPVLVVLLLGYVLLVVVVLVLGPPAATQAETGGTDPSGVGRLCCIYTPHTLPRLPTQSSLPRTDFGLSCLAKSQKMARF